MKITRKNLLSLLTGMERAGQLPADGPTSIFLPGRPLVQLAVRVEGGRVAVYTSRLPFSRPVEFTLEEIRSGV